jgi:hypothetical protein
MPSPRIPAFHAVPVRIRKDGWTPLKQAEFIGHLAETRCVATAARAVGMRRETAYRLRSRAGAESFCAAWDAALSDGGDLAARLGAVERAFAATRPNRKVTLRELEWRSETGLWHVLMKRGRYVGVRQKPDNCALLALVSRVDRSQADWWQERAG